MTERELEIFMDVSPSIQIDDDLNGMLKFRDESLEWYQNDPDRYTQVPYDVIDTINEAQLLNAIQTGLKVDCITRITGYFSKKSQWNPGKVAELKERRKHEVTDSGCASSCPVAQAQ